MEQTRYTTEQKEIIFKYKKQMAKKRIIIEEKKHKREIQDRFDCTESWMYRCLRFEAEGEMAEAIRDYATKTLGYPVVSQVRRYVTK